MLTICCLAGGRSPTIPGRHDLRGCRAGRGERAGHGARTRWVKPDDPAASWPREDVLGDVEVRHQVELW